MLSKAERAAIAARLHAKIKQKQNERSKKGPGNAKNDSKPPFSSLDTSQSGALDLLSRDMWMEVVSHFTDKNSLEKDKDTMKLIATFTLVCKEFRLIIKTPFPGNPLFNRYDGSVMIKKHDGERVQGDSFSSSTVVQLDSDGLVKKVKRPKREPLFIPTKFWFNAFCNPGIGGLRYSN